MRILFLLMFLFSGLSLSSQNLTDKLAAYFSFSKCDGTDDSGNGSSASLLGTPECSCGARDTAFRFDSNDDAMFFIGPISGVFTTGDFAVSFFFRPLVPPQGQGSTQLIMSKQNGCNRDRAFWVRYQPANGTLTASISENDTLSVSVSGKIDRNTCWQHIVLSRSNTRFSLYINGALRDEKNSATRLDLGANTVLKIAEPVCPLDRAFYGDFDELRVYNKPLTGDEVKALYLRPDQILNGDTLIYLGNSFQVSTVSTCAKQYFWRPSTGVSDPAGANPVITPTEPTVYYVQFEHEGCTSTDSLVVDVIDPDTLDCTKIFIPNAFTPGGSPGRNDRFGISNPFAVDQFISFEVFDRWGGRVFNAPTAFETWNGTFGSKRVNPGVFLFRLRYRCDGVEKVKTGSLTLIR